MFVLVSFVKDLGRDIYDLYAEYAEEEEEEEDPFPASPSRLLLSPNKQFILNINVGGTVTSLIFYNNMLLQLTYCQTVRTSHCFCLFSRCTTCPTG